MIIKSISWKQGARANHFTTLLNYINKGVEGLNTPIFHNLKSATDDRSLIAEEFAQNAGYSPKRKNGVLCYHEVLSFQGSHPAEKLENIAQEYLRLRAPNALAYAKLHRDTDNPHIHFCISANQIKQKAKNRMSRAEFERVKTTLREYVKVRYPEILPVQPQKTVLNNQKKLRPKHPPGQTIKSDLSEKILQSFESTQTPTDALKLLAGSGIEMYQRGREAFYGVVYRGKKYRLSTLGVKDGVTQRLTLWKQTTLRLQKLKSIQQAKETIKDLSQRR